MHVSQKSHYAHGIPVRRLCNFLRERCATQINVFLIDSPGSDFTILKDVMENYGTQLSVQAIILECQYYTATSPLYLAGNDCEQIKNYLQQ